jgi:hypothetical protein
MSKEHIFKLRIDPKDFDETDLTVSNKNTIIETTGEIVSDLYYSNESQNFEKLIVSYRESERAPIKRILYRLIPKTNELTISSSFNKQTLPQNQDKHS